MIAIRVLISSTIRSWQRWCSLPCVQMILLITASLLLHFSNPSLVVAWTVVSGYTNFVLSSHLYNQHLISTIIISLQSYHYLISTIIISSLQLSYNLYDQHLISTINISSLQLSYYYNRIISILSTVSLQMILLFISIN